MGKRKHDKTMIELDVAYLKYINESEYWNLKPKENVEIDDGVEEYIHGERLLEPDYFVQDVLPKIKHAGSHWMHVTAENTTSCIVQIHELIMKAAKELNRDPFELADNFFDTQVHVPKKDSYILAQLHEALETRIENMPINQVPASTAPVEAEV